MAINFYNTSAASIEKTKVARGTDSVNPAYLSMVRRQAQSKESRLSPYVTKRTVSSGLTFWGINDKREFKPTTYGWRDTPLGKHNWEQRGVATKPWNDVISIDRSDNSISQYDTIRMAKPEIMFAYGRLKDAVILNSMLQPIIQRSNSSQYQAEVAAENTALNSNAKRYYSVSGENSTSPISEFSTRWKYNLYIDNSTVTANTAVGSVTPKTVERVKRLLRKRLVSDTRTIVWAANTDTMYQLRTNDDFLASETVILPKGSLDYADAGMKYKGFTFVPLLDDVLTQLNFHNIISSQAANSNPRVLCRNLNDVDKDHFGDYTMPELLAADTPIFATAAKAAADIKSGCYAVEGDDETSLNFGMNYIFTPDSVMMVNRPGNSFERLDERTDKSYGMQYYIQVELGSTTLQDEFSLTFLSSGGSIKVAGTGNKTKAG